MIDRVQRTMRRHAMAGPGEPIWVAVSGGVDSMVLLHVLRSMRHACHVVHVDHGLRGPESDADRAFVETECARLRVPCVSVRVDVEARHAGTGESMQMAARELRYQVFQARVAEGPSLLALAHHRDDAIETFFLHLLRGMGLQGWRTIPPRVGPFIRPLIDVDRAAILAYAGEHRIPFREDASNTDPHYLRNRVRHELIPLLEDLRAGSRRTIGRSIGMLRELGAIADGHARAFEGQVAAGTDGSRRVAIDAILHDPAPMWVLHTLFQGDGLHPDRMEDVLIALEERSVGARFPMGGVEAVVDREHLVIGPVGKMDVRWTITGVDGLPDDAPIELSQVLSDGIDTGQGPAIAWFDADALRFPLELRTWRAGDRMRPIGLGGSKLISDLLTDAKVPAGHRPRALVLVSGGDIVWLCGHRIGEGFQATVRSRQVVRCAFKQGPGTADVFSTGMPQGSLGGLSSGHPKSAPMPIPDLIPKERIPSLRFPRQPVLLSADEHTEILGKLNWATRLGNAEHGKCRILFQDDKGLKAVETTIWAFDAENIVLKYGMTIPVARVVAIEIP